MNPRVCLLSGCQGGAEVGTWERDWLVELAHRARPQRYTLVDEPEKADLILFTDLFFNHRFWRVLRHPVVRAYRERCYAYSEKALCSRAMPGLYTGLPQSPWDLERFRGAAYTVHEHYHGNPYLEEARGQEPRFLCSYLGRPSHPVRRRLLRVLGGLEGCHLEDTAAYDHWNPKQGDRQHWMRRYAQILGSSHFVLCPRGWSVSSIRLYETMRVGRVPVILADRWRPPLGPEWQSFSLQLPESRVASLPALLEGHRSRAPEMGQRAREAWEAYFSPEREFNFLMDSLLDLHRRRPWKEAWMVPLQPFFLAHMSLRAQAYSWGRRLAGLKAAFQGRTRS